MKNFRTLIDNELDRLDLKWRALPLKMQYKYVVIFFTCYLLLCVGVLGAVWYELGKDDQEIAIDHIESSAIGKGELQRVDTGLNKKKILRNGRERE